MASNFRSVSFTAALFFAVLFLSNVNAVTAILAREFDSMLETLRVRGYDLFCNAIVTSDLQFDVMLYQNENDLNNNASFQSFTFFAPTDSSLFALDMTQTASSYTDTLRYHVVPRRLSATELHLLTFGYSVPTLLPGRYLKITRVLGSHAIAVGGVDIAFPGLFYGRDVAVHGLAGILNLRSNNPPPSAVHPVRSSGQQSFPPRIDTISSNTPPVDSLTPESNTFDVTNRPGSSLPVNGTSLAPTPDPTGINSHSPAISPVISGDSPASSTEPPVHSHISAPAAPAVLTPTTVSPEYRYSAVYLPPTEPPLHSHISTPMAPAALSPTPASLEYRHSAVSSPPIGFSDGPLSPLGPDVWVSLMETFTGGYERESQTVRFAEELPETPPPLAEKKDVAEESGLFDGIVGCATRDGFADSTSRDRFQRLQCHYA